MKKEGASLSEIEKRIKRSGKILHPLKPIIVVNFKTYPQSTGKNAVKLAKACERAAKAGKANIFVAVQATDIAAVARAVGIPVFAQHVDADEQGQHTGAVSPEAIKAAGASGSLVNHSERQLPLDVIKRTVERLHKLGLDAVVCANNADMAYKVACFKPDAVAVEPPELIGGNVSVSTAHPELIEWSVKAVKDGNPNTLLLVGAGVKNNADIKKSLELGAKGVLLASGIVLDKNPEKALMGLVG